MEKGDIFLVAQYFCCIMYFGRFLWQKGIGEERGEDKKLYVQFFCCFIFSFVLLCCLLFFLLLLLFLHLLLLIILLFLRYLPYSLLSISFIFSLFSSSFSYISPCSFSSPPPSFSSISCSSFFYIFLVFGFPHCLVSMLFFPVLLFFFKGFFLYIFCCFFPSSSSSLFHRFFL